MERLSSGGAGSCMGMVAVAVVSTSVILISYRRLEADLRVRILGGDGAADQQDRCPRRPRGTKKKKVRFADDVAEPSSNSEEYRRRARSSSTATSARLA